MGEGGGGKSAGANSNRHADRHTGSTYLPHVRVHHDLFLTGAVVRDLQPPFGNLPLQKISSSLAGLRILHLAMMTSIAMDSYMHLISFIPRTMSSNLWDQTGMHPRIQSIDHKLITVTYLTTFYFWITQ